MVNVRITVDNTLGREFFRPILYRTDGRIVSIPVADEDRVAAIIIGWNGDGSVLSPSGKRESREQYQARRPWTTNGLRRHHRTPFSVRQNDCAEARTSRDDQALVGC